MAGDLISVAEALKRVLDRAQPLAREEMIPLRQAFGRTLAKDLRARRTQPPTDVSAMDGYGLRAGDLAAPGARVRLIGESAAGHSFSGESSAGEVRAGQCVRIFTGAPAPRGIDTILLQEDALVERGENGVLIGAQSPPRVDRHIRRRGVDFLEGAVGLRAGARLGPAELSFAAAMNHDALPVVGRPRVGVIATGDELVAPGYVFAAGETDKIVCSNNFAIAALIEEAGGCALDLGLVGDDLAATERAIQSAGDCEVLVTLGGASVGDHDYVKQALVNQGMKLDFWRLAMRPGKPLIHGALGAQSVLGLPGNPVSSLVCALLFLVPLIRKLSGDPAPERDKTLPAILGADMPANDRRQDFLRARLTRDARGALVAAPFELQDSSLLSVLAAADALLIRPPHAPAAQAGELCRILPLRPSI